MTRTDAQDQESATPDIQRVALVTGSKSCTVAMTCRCVGLEGSVSITLTESET